MPPKTRPRHRLTSRGQEAVLSAIELLDEKVDDLKSSVKETGDKVTRLQIEQSEQTAVLNGVNQRVQTLEGERVAEDRIKRIEDGLKTAVEKIDKLDKEQGKQLPEQEQIAKDLTELKNDFKPVSQFVDRAKVMLPLITGLGGIIGAIITAVVLRVMGLR